MIKKTIVALDQLSKDEIKTLIPRLHSFEYFKLGLEIFNAYGKDFIHEFTITFNKKVFLDLKLHDIPKTVERAIAGLEGLNIEFLTIHLSGGKEMIKSAMRARDLFLPSTKLLGVSYLTSLDNQDFNELFGLKPSEVENQFKRIFALAATCKLDGLISSPHEISMIKEIESSSKHQFLKITPGIRMSTDIKVIDDQKRVMTPKDAFNQGSDFIVMGRAITQAKNLGEVINYLKTN